MKFSVTVRAAPDTSAHLLALKTCQALLAQGHDIAQVFFYGDGVSVASNLQLPDQDVLSLLPAWQALHSTHQIPLYVCVAAALKRGILNAQEAALNGITQSNCATGFEVVGLGEWVAGLEDTYKQVTFS